ncbi:hypothetical protein BDZ94DRAFT_1247374 [Collybia nuda]|uniref:C2H2-type domain-containing protein n=1 Tax=Collybia nuda TaxID=64659 RepID=A0A9P5YFW7_9AGAR|nr:hypothetical protein BDZ94DRAFT_1247374 [Collybia nuda]
MADIPEPEVIDLTGLTESSEGSNEEDNSSDHSSSQGSSSIYEGGVAVNESSRAQLHDAISTVSEGRLRQILKSLVETIPAVEIALMGELVARKRKTREVVPRWETCANCDQDFDVHEEREDDECIFHPGDLEVDEGSFADWDEDCHGPKDTSSNRRDYPENFQWTCCDKDGLSEGCVQGEHKSAAPRKRRRV